MASANMYRVGDYVYFDSSSAAPYQVRRLEELNKTPNGNVEAKVMCFFRRRDLPASLNFLADKHQSALEEEEGKDRETLTAKQKHLLKHRELFLSRQVETLPATQIRGKCTVTLLNETENLLSYLNKDDAFFYSLVYDPQQKTLLADRGEIRVGQRYQAEAPKPMLKEGESDGRVMEELEQLTWTPDHSLTDKQIDQFLVLSRSVGTFARALDSSSSVKQPSLHMSAAAASRDVTLFHAMDTLHKYSYDISASASALVPSSGPLLCRDEMEEWSASEANLFEEALEKYGKDFTDIRADFLPWKTLTNIIEYYYMWKTTDRYVQQKRVKAAEAETKLKQVYIPNYNKPNPAALPGIKGMLNGGDQLIPGKACESCMLTPKSTGANHEWFAWTSLSGVQAKLCHQCWHYWRKYGGLKNVNKLHDMLKPTPDGEIEKKPPQPTGPLPSLEDGELLGRNPGLLQQRVLHRCAVAGCNKEFKMKNQLARHYAANHGFSMRSGSPRPVMKTRTAFYLHTTPMTRVARRVCSDILKTRHATRCPFWPVNVVGVKQECQQRVVGKTPEELKAIVHDRHRKSKNAKVSDIPQQLGLPIKATPDWLVLTEKSKIPQPLVIAYPKPPKGPDGSLIYERVPDKIIAPIVSVNNVSPSLLKRRNVDEVHGSEGDTGQPISKRAKSSSRGASPLTVQQPPTATPSAITNAINALNHIANGTKTKIASVTRVGSRKQIITWMDAPDDLYFNSTEGTKKLRRSLTSNEMRRLARSPCKKVINKAVNASPTTTVVSPAVVVTAASNSPLSLTVPPPIAAEH